MRDTGSPASIVRRPAGTPSHAEEAVGVGGDEREPAGDHGPGTAWPLALNTTPSTAPLASITMATDVVVRATTFTCTTPTWPLPGSTATTAQPRAGTNVANTKLPVSSVVA